MKRFFARSWQTSSWVLGLASVAASGCVGETGVVVDALKVRSTDDGALIVYGSSGDIRQKWMSPESIQARSTPTPVPGPKAPAELVEADVGAGNGWVLFTAEGQARASLLNDSELFEVGSGDASTSQWGLQALGDGSVLVANVDTSGVIQVKKLKPGASSDSGGVRALDGNPALRAASGGKRPHVVITLQGDYFAMAYPISDTQSALVRQAADPASREPRAIITINGFTEALYTSQGETPRTAVRMGDGSVRVGDKVAKLPAGTECSAVAFDAKGTAVVLVVTATRASLLVESADGFVESRWAEVSNGAGEGKCSISTRGLDVDAVWTNDAGDIEYRRVVEKATSGLKDTLKTQV